MADEEQTDFQIVEEMTGDKWDTAVHRIQNAILAEEAEAAAAAALGMFADFGRTLDRIADSLETIANGPKFDL